MQKRMGPLKTEAMYFASSRTNGDRTLALADAAIASSQKLLQEHHTCRTRWRETIDIASNNLMKAHRRRSPASHDCSDDSPASECTELGFAQTLQRLSETELMLIADDVDQRSTEVMKRLALIAEELLRRDAAADEKPPHENSFTLTYLPQAFLHLSDE